MLYPFTAIVGQDENEISPVTQCHKSICRWCVNRGEKGTAKSTAVRALANLLPLWRQGLQL